MDLQKVVQSGITAAIIYKTDFIVLSAALKVLNNGITKQFNVFCFVIAGNNERKLQKISSHISE